MVVVRGYRDLQVWQKAMDLVVETYRLSKDFPQTEIYGLTSQMQRAAVSVPANIAEGHGREHLGDYLHHLSVANGSLMELETHCLIAVRLEYLEGNKTKSFLSCTSELGRMMSGLIRKLKIKHLGSSRSIP